MKPQEATRNLKLITRYVCQAPQGNMFWCTHALPGSGCDIAIELAGGETRAGSHRDDVGPQVGGEDAGSAGEAAGGV